MTTIHRPDNYSSLVQYVKEHPQQTDEVAEAFRTSATSILDYCEDTLRNRPDHDRATAYDAAKELAEAFQEVQRATETAKRINGEAAAAARKQLAAGEAVVLRTPSNPVQVQLAAAHNDVTEGSIPKFGTLSQNPGKWRHGAVLRTTIAYDAETLETDRRGYYDDVEPGIQRQAFNAAVKQVKEGSPLLRALLIDQAVDPSTVGESKSNLSGFSSSGSSSSRGLIHKRVSSWSNSSLSGDGHAQWGPALADGLLQIDSLKELVSHIVSCPATWSSVKASNTIKATASIEYTKGIVHKRRLTTEVRLPFIDQYGEPRMSICENRTLGDVPNLPAYLDLERY